MKKKLFALIGCALFFILPLFSAQESDPAEFSLRDTPNNAGEQVEFTFTPLASPEEMPEFLLNIVIGENPVRVRRLVNAGKPIILPLITRQAGVPVSVKVQGILPDGSLQELGTVEVVSKGEWINMNSMKAFI
ncbi:MAG TPA: hypothetical protein ENL15_01040, partial [Firmicutes bacterium]|nr:hypothetical protein [Bacillota bacterium]